MSMLNKKACLPTLKRLIKMRVIFAIVSLIVNDHHVKLEGDNPWVFILPLGQISFTGTGYLPNKLLNNSLQLCLNSACAWAHSSKRVAIKRLWAATLTRSLSPTT